MSEFTVYQPYTQEKMVDLSKQFQPMQGETQAAWLCGSGTQSWAQHLWGFSRSLLREAEG